MPANYKIVGDSDEQNIVVIIPGKPSLGMHSSNLNFAEVVREAKEEAPDFDRLAALFDIAQAADERFRILYHEDDRPSRVAIKGGRVYLDYKEVDNSLARQIVRFVSEGSDFAPLLKFYDKLLANPSENSREQLYDWLNAHEFSINEDGDIVGYKGVHKVDEGGFESSSSGSAIVDGEQQNGHIRQDIGSLVEMPRDEVVDDPRDPCSTGLHVATHSFADGFINYGYNSGGVVLSVLVSPTDVVSVPSDGRGEKVRVCRYRVLGIEESPYALALVPTEYSDPAETYTAAEEPDASSLVDEGPDPDGLHEDEEFIEDETQYCSVCGEEEGICENFDGCDDNERELEDSTRKLVNRKTGREWIVDSAGPVLVKMKDAETGEKQTKSAIGITKSFRKVNW